MKKYNVAVVGVGAVGEEMLRVLAQRKFPAKDIKVFGRSSRNISVDGTPFFVDVLNENSFQGIDIALFAGTEGEKGAAVTFAAAATDAGCIVIDNGADFRMDKSVPLVVPEVNGKDVKKHKGIIANPNCSTIQMVVALNPIYKKYGIKRVIASTYQAVSGAGRSAINQTESEFRAWAANELFQGEKAMDHEIAFNLIPQIGSFTADGYTTEEIKMVKETQKILHDQKIKISCTTVRVPVKNAHSEAVYIETKKTVDADKIRELLSRSAGIEVIDDPQKKQYPMPKDSTGKDSVFVGRIRRDPSNKCGLWLWIVSDNLRKGAALNAVQIAEELIRQKVI